MVSRKVNRKLKRKQTKVKRALNKKKQTFKLSKNFRVKRISKKNIKLKSIQNYQSIGGADGKSARAKYRDRERDRQAKHATAAAADGMKNKIRAFKNRILPKTAKVVGTEDEVEGKMEAGPTPAVDETGREFHAKVLGHDSDDEDDEYTDKVNVVGIVENED